MTAKNPQRTGRSDNAADNAADNRSDKTIKLVRGPGYVGFTLPGVPSACREARAVLRGYLGASGLTDNVLTCTSELVANAILHTRSGLPGGVLAVTLEVDRARSVLVSVLDEGPRAPQRKAPARPANEHGRGLGMVEVLSDEWGLLRVGTGRLTWFRIRGVRGVAALGRPRSETVSETTAETLTETLRRDAPETLTETLRPDGPETLPRDARRDAPAPAPRDSHTRDARSAA